MRADDRGHELTTNLVLIACAGSAGIHAALVAPHLAESRRLGLGFAIAAGALVAVGLRIAHGGGTPRAAAAAAALFAGLIGAYALSRTVGLGALGEAPEPLDAVGVTTQAVQAVGLLAALELCRPAGGRRALAAVNGKDHP